MTSPNTSCALAPSLAVIPNGLSDSQLDSLGRVLYRQRILNPFADRPSRAIVASHDDTPVYFFEDAFDHAFWGSTRRNYGVKKEFPCPLRIARIPWVVPVIQGTVPGVSCYRWVDHSSERRPKPEQRLYVYGTHPAQPYVVWLPKRGDGNFKLYSAYPTTWSAVGDYTHRQSKIWPRS